MAERIYALVPMRIFSACKPHYPLEPLLASANPFAGASRMAFAVHFALGRVPLPHRFLWLSGLALRLLALLFLALLFVAHFTEAAEAQAPQAAPSQSGMGNSTGAASKAVFDSENRPITAGGFVSKGPIVFADFSKKSHLATWSHTMGAADKGLIIDADGSGVGLIDYDNDGWLDIYMVNGSTFDALDGKTPPPHAALFHNNHDGTFTDVAATAGVTNDRWGYGVAIGDFDNDGWPDIAVSNWGKNRLYRNNHNGTFTDVAEKAGITLGNWSAGITWGDYDGDGLLDLFISGYIHFDRNRLPISGNEVVGYASCKFRGVVSMCGPRGLEGEPDHLFHNNGDGTFTDVSVLAGVSDPNRYYGFTAIFVDINDDGKPDLLVANDSVPNYLYLNKGNGTFEDDGYFAGFAVNKDGREVASMGLGLGDYENNGLLDIIDTDFSDDYKVLFHNDGDASFTDVSYEAGIARETLPFVGWGDAFIDYDNDGLKDIFMVNGHVYPDAGDHAWGTSYAERPLLFHNLGKGKFEAVPPVTGTGLAVVVSARGAAFGDLFNDGRIDVVINPIDGPAVLLRNVNPDHHHWVELKLVGGPKSPRDAMCANVLLTANGMIHREDVLSSGSYISSNDQRLHFGLGDATDPGTVEIRWPSGAKESIKLPSADRVYTITEGVGITGALCGGSPCLGLKKPGRPAKKSAKPSTVKK